MAAGTPLVALRGAHLRFGTTQVFGGVSLALEKGERRIHSTLIDFGIPGGDSAMARTVSLPVAIATNEIINASRITNSVRGRGPVGGRMARKVGKSCSAQIPRRHSASGRRCIAPQGGLIAGIFSHLLCGELDSVTGYRTCFGGLSGSLLAR